MLRKNEGKNSKMLRKSEPLIRRQYIIIFVCVQPYSTTLFGVPFLLPTSQALGSATQGQARDRDSRAALGKPQDKRHVRQTYLGRSARVATRPESQVAPPHTDSIFRDDCQLPAIILLTSGYSRWTSIYIYILHFMRLEAKSIFDQTFASKKV
jgi:hypothetical protein